MFKKTLTLGYGVLSYLLFFGIFNYTIMFIGNMQYKKEVPMFVPNIGKKGSQDIVLERA